MRFSLLISLDLDNFKVVNDKLGHLSGDELLRQAGERFNKAINIQDCVCHIGGDKYLFLIKSVDNINEAEIIVKKIQNVFKTPFVIGEIKVDYVTASIGIAIIPQDGNDFETLYKCADDAMYAAKISGENSHCFYNENIIKKKAIEEGLENGEFEITETMIIKNFSFTIKNI